MFTEDEKRKFKIYTMAVSKPLFFVFAAGVVLRLFMLFLYDDTDTVTIDSITLAFAICLVGSVFLSVTVSVIAIFKERA